MRSFTYKITDAAGLHARPAGLLSKKAKEFSSSVIVSLNEKDADAGGIFSLMGLEAKCGDIITLTISGEDEELATGAIESFLKDNL